MGNCILKQPEVEEKNDYDITRLSEKIEDRISEMIDINDKLKHELVDMKDNIKTKLKDENYRKQIIPEKSDHD